MAEACLGPGPDQDLLGLVEARLRLMVVDAKALIIIDVVGGAAAEADDEPALEDVVEHRQLLGEPDRVVQRHLQDREADFAVPGGGGERASKGDRVGIGADAVEMMLGQPDRVDAQFVGEPGFAQGLVDHDPVALGIAAVGKQEIAEFHAATPRAGAVYCLLALASPPVVASCVKRPVASPIAGVARQIDEFEHGAVGIIEISARPVQDAALAIFLEGDRDPMRAQMIEGGRIILVRHGKGMMHAAMVVGDRVDRRLALYQDHAGSGRIEKRHPPVRHRRQMPAADDIGIKSRARRDVADRNAEMRDAI